MDSTYWEYYKWNKFKGIFKMFHGFYFTGLTKENLVKRKKNLIISIYFLVYIFVAFIFNISNYFKILLVSSIIYYLLINANK